MEGEGRSGRGEGKEVKKGREERRECGGEGERDEKRMMDEVDCFDDFS